MNKNSRLVYSTDQGRIKSTSTPPATGNSGSDESGDGIVRLHRETKGRKGKGVTRLVGIDRSEADKKLLAKQLKQQCGVGGAIKDGVIEIQTDDRQKLKTLLEQQGFTVKLAGG